MKLATLKQGGRDGTLVVVSRDLTRCRAVPAIARTLQSDQVLVACNRHPTEPRTISLPRWQTASPASRFTDAFNGDKFEVVQGEVQLTIPANSARVLLSS